MSEYSRKAYEMENELRIRAYLEDLARNIAVDQLKIAVEALERCKVASNNPNFPAATAQTALEQINEAVKRFEQHVESLPEQLSPYHKNILNEMIYGRKYST